MEKKYRVYRIFVQGVAALRCSAFVDNIEKFRKEVAETYKVKIGRVKFCYEIDEPYTGRDR